MTEFNIVSHGIEEDYDQYMGKAPNENGSYSLYGNIYTRFYFNGVINQSFFVTEDGLGVALTGGIVPCNKLIQFNPEGKGSSRITSNRTLVVHLDEDPAEVIRRLSPLPKISSH